MIPKIEAQEWMCDSANPGSEAPLRRMFGEETQFGASGESQRRC